MATVAQLHAALDPGSTMAKIPVHFYAERQGKLAALYAGLLDLAHREGLKRIETDLVQAPSDANGQTAICKARVEMESGRVFTGIGDANAQNVGRMIAMHIIRMSETRAKARALRDALNIGGAAEEEMGGAGEYAGDDDADTPSQPQQARPTPPQGRAPAQPARPQQPAPQPAQRPVSYEDLPDTATAPPEVLAGLRRTAASLKQATGQLTPIEDGITMGDARSLKQAMKDAMDKAAPAGQQPAKATPPQIDRLLKLLAAVGRPATAPPDLTSEDATARIRELVGIFNQQARGHTQPAAVGGK